VRDWNRRAADAYAALRADCESRGVSLSPLDTMIAAHAIAEDAVLVTRDKAFTQVEGRLRVEDWTSA
jgi:tRNA(fMet)-specific endonuclease VapC